jgi:hypothetical protein
MTTTTTATIDLELIQTGHELMIRHDRNRLQVRATRSATITAAALNTTVTIATRTRAGNWKLADRMHIDWHPPSMF